DAAGVSNYSPQTFGGILHFTSRAIADFEKQHHTPANDRPAQSRPVQSSAGLPEHERRRGEIRLSVLTVEQQMVWLEKTRTELCRQYPAMAQLLTRMSSAAAEKTIRGWLIRRLATETMDLVVLGGGASPASQTQNLFAQNLTTEAREI